MKKWILVTGILSLLLAVMSCSPVDNADVAEPDVPGENPAGPDDPDSGGGKYDFDFTIGFELFGEPYWAEENGGYAYGIFMGFGVPAYLYSRGIYEFGLEVRASSGEIIDKNGWDGDVHISRDGSWVYFSGLITSARAYDWEVIMYVVSKEKHIELSYRWRLFDNEIGKYVRAPYDWEKSVDFYAE